MKDGRQIVRCPGCNAEVVATYNEIQHHVRIRRIPHEEAVRRGLTTRGPRELYATDEDGHIVWQERVSCSNPNQA